MTIHNREGTLSIPPMLPEDRKHLDVPPIPEPGSQFQKNGRIWLLVSVQTKISPAEHQRLTFEFIAVDSVNPVNPV